ncbi:MAG: Flp1 family type IVb pilin [Pseudobdellovibrionaceae bacterium]
MKITKFKKSLNTQKNLIKDQSGQGATEYILLLVVVVALVLLFQKQIKETVAGKISELSGKISEVQ